MHKADSFGAGDQEQQPGKHWKECRRHLVQQSAWLPTSYEDVEYGQQHCTSSGEGSERPTERGRYKGLSVFRTDAAWRPSYPLRCWTHKPVGGSAAPPKKQ